MDGTPQGERIRLRFVTRAETSLLRTRYGHEPGGFNDFGDLRAEGAPAGQGDADPHDGPHGVARGQEDTDQVRNDHSGVLWVEPLDGSVPLGTVEYHRVAYGPNPQSRAWMIGIDLRPEARGRGYGAEAQRLLADWLFETTTVNRVEAETDVENLAEARSLEKAGFKREGIIRGAQFRAGAFHDLVVFSRVRADGDSS
ncbi:MAG TPA: GNAT family protein [Candidatus Limnocylindrales bacterium]|nr:GNAT family protein [Candidatus Limnocylindrales bacterium]